jgi:hypothetical protein
MNENLSYPIGRLEIPIEITPVLRHKFIEQIADAPSLLRKAVEGLSDKQLDTPYRPGGWTLRRVVHHLPDSHLNGYMRIKLALTENLPVIKTYDQETWSAVADIGLPVEGSLRMLEGLHEIWTGLLRSLTEQQWHRGFIHPELRASPTGNESWRQFFRHDGTGMMTIDSLLPTYAWHGRHHTAHITDLRRRMGWN